TDRDGGEMKRIETTVGRALLNQILPTELGKYYNDTMGRKQLRGVVADSYRTFNDPRETANVVNNIKKLGFQFSTKGGLTFALSDVTTSETKKDIVGLAEERASGIERQ